MSYVLPCFVMLIMLFSIRKTQVYSAFVDGVSKGIKTLVSIFPAILAIMVVSSMLDASGIFNMVQGVLSPFTEKIGLPSGVLKLALIRPMSGGASLGLLTDILNRFGADSREGEIASVIMAASETTFYTISVYFKNTRIKYTSYIIPAAIIGDIVGIITAVFACKLFF